jgi:hypothetical protein
MKSWRPFSAFDIQTSKQRFKNLLQIECRFFTMYPKMNLRKLIITVAVAFLLNSFVPLAFADEKPSAFQTALDNTTISGSVESSIVIDNSGPAASNFSASFSPSPIPEPSSSALFVMGTLTLIAFASAKKRTVDANEKLAAGHRTTNLMYNAVSFRYGTPLFLQYSSGSRIVVAVRSDSVII